MDTGMNPLKKYELRLDNSVLLIVEARSLMDACTYVDPDRQVLGYKVTQLKHPRLKLVGDANVSSE